MGDVLSAVSVLIVFATVFLNLLSRKVDHIVQQTRPSAAEHNARRELIVKFRRILFGMALPLSLSLSVISYILLPTSINIKRQFIARNFFYSCFHVTFQNSFLIFENRLLLKNSLVFKLNRWSSHDQIA